MSMAKLLVAALGRAKTILTLDEAHACVSLDGQPPPFAGEEFLVVHPGSFFNAYDEGIEEEFEVDFTLTRRLGYVPADREGVEVLTKASVGLYARVEALRAGIHMDYAGHFAAVNEALGAAVDGFWKPLCFRRCSPPVARGASWFWSDEEGEQASGVSVTLSFAGAMRTQTIESMT